MVLHRSGDSKDWIWLLGLLVSVSAVKRAEAAGGKGGKT